MGVRPIGEGQFTKGLVEQPARQTPIQEASKAMKEDDAAKVRLSQREAPPPPPPKQERGKA